ncbi:MAG: hypothetical protein WCS28_02000 [Thiomicrospira sp.]
MKNKIMLLTSMLAVFGMSGCGNSVYDCSNEEVIATVKEIALKEFDRQVGQSALAIFDDAGTLKNMVAIELNSINPIEVNKKLGTYQCAADLKMYFRGKPAGGGEIKYLVQKSASNGYYVTVSGL